MSSKKKYYKAVAPDGYSFRGRNRVKWIDTNDGLVTHPGCTWEVHGHEKPTKHKDVASSYLSVSTTPTGCIGFKWPARLLLVEARGHVMDSSIYPTKRAGLTFQVVKELPAHMLFGAHGKEVVYMLSTLHEADYEVKMAMAGQFQPAWLESRFLYYRDGVMWGSPDDAIMYYIDGQTFRYAINVRNTHAFAAVSAVMRREELDRERYLRYTRLWRRTFGKIFEDDPR